MKRIQTALLIAIIGLTGMTSFKPRKVIFLGDSITWHGQQDTDGYVNLLRNRLKVEQRVNQFDLVGAGVSGNKIYDLYFRLDKDVLAQKPDLVYIYIGVNDIWHKALTGTGTDIGRFRQCYALIIERIQATGAKVVLCTPAVIGERKSYMNEQDGDLNLYSQTVSELAEKYHCGFINLRKAFLDYDSVQNLKDVEKGLLTRDKVHLTSAGNHLVASLMYQELIK